MDNLRKTLRHKDGFFSTKKCSDAVYSPSPTMNHNKKNSHKSMHNIHDITPENNDNEKSDRMNHPDTNIVNIIPTINIFNTDISLPYNITLSPDPTDQTMESPLNLCSEHPALGLQLQLEKNMNQIQLLQYLPGT